jgi:hypothetical protein
MVASINKQEFPIRDEIIEVNLKKTDELTRTIMKEIFNNHTFKILYQEANKMLKLGIVIHSAESKKFTYTNGSSSHFRRVKPFGKTDGIIIEYDKNINVPKAKRLIIFELANATFSKNFDQLDIDSRNGKISKKDYVRNNEYYEWLALKKAYEAINIIDKKLLKNITEQLNEFEYHLSIQKTSGHSSVYERCWEELCPGDHKKLLENTFPLKNSIEGSKVGKIEEIEKSILIGLIVTISALCLRRLVQFYSPSV